MVKLDRERFNRRSVIMVMVNPPNTDKLFGIGYEDILKMECEDDYIKRITYLTKSGVNIIDGVFILEVWY